METISPPKPASGELFVQEVGRGNPVALLHGSPTALGFFAPLVDSLKGSCRVLVPEMSGYGRSPAVEYGASFARSQDLLEEALLSRGASEVALVGFSLGAYRALDLALRGRIRVTRIVTIGGFAGLTLEHKAAFRALTAQVREMADFTNPAFRRAVALQMVSPGFATREPGALSQIEGWLDCISPGPLADELLAVTNAADLHSRLGMLRIPLLALVGELDAAAPMAYSERLVASVPGARLEVFHGCGHALLVEEPSRATASVRAGLGLG